MAGLAFRINDSGASGGIIVSPMGLQEGAEKVARAAHIESVRLDADCTTENFILGYLNRIRFGMLEHLPPGQDSLTIKVIEKGKVISEETV